jgi:hypothetical protein
MKYDPSPLGCSPLQECADTVQTLISGRKRISESSSRTAVTAAIIAFKLQSWEQEPQLQVSARVDIQSKEQEPHDCALSHRNSMFARNSLANEIC